MLFPQIIQSYTHVQLRGDSKRWEKSDDWESKSNEKPKPKSSAYVKKLAHSWLFDTTW